MFDFEGNFDVLFVGRETYVSIVVTGAIVDGYGHPIYLEGPNNTIYNWSNVVVLKKKDR